MTDRILRGALRALLALAPRAFRRRYGEEVLEVAAERLRGRPTGALRGLRFAAREVIGMALLVLRLRLGAGADAPEVAAGATSVRCAGSGATTTTGRGGIMLDTLAQDLRFAGRTLLRHPVFALTAVVVLALGIGANAAIFSAANAYVFRPLPFGDPDRLVMLYETNPEFGWDDANGAPANVLDWREQVDAFEDVTMYSGAVNRATYQGGEEPELLAFTEVAGNFFDVLRVPARVGRTLRWEETWQGDDRVVVMSHDLWVSRFGADPDVVGRTLEFEGTSVEVVGVMPEGFAFPDSRVDLWTPFGWPRENREQVWFRRAHFVRPVARLAPDATLQEADAQLQVVVDRLSRDYPETNEVMGAGMTPLRRFITRGMRTPLLVLGGAGALLLLLACTNVANLLLVRASHRSREVALRQALGAGRSRLVRLMLTESLLLAVLGGASGLGLGWLGVRAVERLQPLGIDGATTVALDHRVVLFVVAVTALAGLFFGVAPALRSIGGRLQEALADGGARGSSASGRRSTAHLLVAAEVALALLLVVGAGLLVRSLVELRNVDPGIETEETLAVRFTIPPTRYPARDQVLAFYDRFVEGLEGRPGIERAGTVAALPLTGLNYSSQFQAEGWPPDRVGFEVVHRRADRGYFEALGIPVVRGRLFGSADGPDDPRVLVVNETFAREHFPGEDPVGQRIAFDRQAARNPDEHTWWEIVGVVGDQHQERPGVPPVAEVYENPRQSWSRSNWVVMRTTTDPTSVVPAVRDVLREMDPDIPLASARPLHQVWRTSMARDELVLSLLGAFALVALLLAAVGVYGVTAQAARSRTREIGIRLALGATGRDVVGMMLRQGLGVVFLGLVAGLGAALLATRVLTTLLYRVEPTDPATLAAVVALLAGVAAAACYLPARRATAVDPVESLRVE